MDRVNCLDAVERSKNNASAGNRTPVVRSFIPQRSHSIDWVISGLLQTDCLVGGVFCGMAWTVSPRHVQDNAFFIHIAVRRLPSYERMIRSPQPSACFISETPEIPFRWLGRKLDFLPSGPPSRCWGDLRSSGMLRSSSGNPLSTCRGHHSGPSLRIKKSKNKMTYWPLKMGLIGCPETSIKDYHSPLRNTPEERRNQT
jgi:hypothetical protein